MSTMSALARALLRDSWTHLQVVFAPTARRRTEAETTAGPAPPKPFPVGSIVVHVADGPPRIVLGYKPDGRCMSAYLTPPPWMQRSLSMRVLIDDPADLRTLDPRLEESC